MKKRKKFELREKSLGELGAPTTFHFSSLVATLITGFQSLMGLISLGT